MKKIKLMVVLVMVGIMLAATLAAPAEACACGTSGPAGAMQFAQDFNSQPYEFRSTANVLPPAQYGWAMSTDYYMVGMNLCGQTVECF